MNSPSGASSSKRGSGHMDVIDVEIPEHEREHHLLWYNEMLRASLSGRRILHLMRKSRPDICGLPSDEQYYGQDRGCSRSTRTSANSGSSSASRPTFPMKLEESTPRPFFPGQDHVGHLTSTSASTGGVLSVSVRAEVSASFAFRRLLFVPLAR